MIQAPRRSNHFAIESRRRLRYLLMVSLAMLMVSLVMVLASREAFAAADPWPSRPIALPLTCPEALVLQPTVTGDYVFVAGAKQYAETPLDVILYTSKAAYELTLLSFKIDRPSEAHIGTLRSAGVLIHGLPGEPYLGTSISSVGTSCGASRLIALTAAASSNVGASHGRPDPFMSSVLKDTIPTGGAVEPEQVAGSKPPPCLEPFVRARTDVVSVPAYPAIAREQGAVGTTLVEVRLDSGGRVIERELRKSAGNAALDVAALRAASATTYVPATFDCRNDGGSYLFRADFTQQ